MTNSNRQPAGTPVGGQYAAGVRGETGTELAATEPTIPERYRGTCHGCDGPVGLLEDGQVAHLDESGQPIVGDEARATHDPEFDPYTYDGGEADTIAEASGWGSSQWERYEDSRAAREVEDAYGRGAQAAKASLVGGFDAKGPTNEVRERAAKAMRDAETVFEIAGAKAAAEDILAAYPDAAVLELEENYDDDGSTDWAGGRILDANGEHIADFEEFEDDHWGPVSDLPGKPKYDVVVQDDGSTRNVGDARYGFMAWDGNRRQGYTAKLDLKAAAAVDLTTLIDDPQ